MLRPALLTTALLLPGLWSGIAQAQTIAGDSPTAPVPQLSTDLATPETPRGMASSPQPLIDQLETAPSLPASETPAGAATLSFAPSDAGTPSHTVSAETESAVQAENPDIIPANSQEPAAETASADAPAAQGMQGALDLALTFLRDGGPSIWAIAALSVVTLALILWKIWRLALMGAWSRGAARKAIDAFENGHAAQALAQVSGRRGMRSHVVAAAITALDRLPEEHAREETARIAKRELASARSGLGALELISTIAPLLGLLGTVMGMISAFQALQAAGSNADPSMLAGGIWEALLTTAAGMAVAIPASAALTWFELIIDRMRRDVEDGATRLFIRPEPQKMRLVAE